MYQVERGDGPVVTVTFRGTVTIEEVEAAVAEAEHASAGQDPARLLLTFDDAKLPALLVLKERLRHSEHIRPLVARVDRAAVVTDQFWIRTASRAQALLVGKIATRDFPLTRAEDARAFLSDPAA